VRQRDPHRRWVCTGARCFDERGAARQQPRPELGRLPTQYLAGSNVEQRVRAITDETRCGDVRAANHLALHRLHRKPRPLRDDSDDLAHTRERMRASVVVSAESARTVCAPRFQRRACWRRLRRTRIGTPTATTTAATRTQSGKTRYNTTPTATRATSQANRSR